MELHTIADKPGVFIGYDPVNEWIYVDWRGEHTQETSQAVCLLMLDVLRAHPCHKILNDNSNITQTTVELTEWGAWWLGEMRSAGLQYIAWVLPRNFAARQRTETMVQVIENPTVSTFDDTASAYVWLQQKIVPLVIPAHDNASATRGS